MADLSPERIEEVARTARNFPPHDEVLADFLDECADALREARAERDEAVAVCNGVLWLDDNLHNYGSDAWRTYFKACVRDARRVAALAASDTPEQT